jgi:hypothetical protein
MIRSSRSPSARHRANATHVLGLVTILAAIVSTPAFGQAAHGRGDRVVLEVAAVVGPASGGSYFAPDGLAGIHGALAWRLWIADGQVLSLTIFGESFLGSFADNCILDHQGPGATCLPYLDGLHSLMLQWAGDVPGNPAASVVAGAGVIENQCTRTGAVMFRAELVPQRGRRAFAMFAQHLLVPSFRGTRLAVTLMGIGLQVR